MRHLNHCMLALLIIASNAAVPGLSNSAEPVRVKRKDGSESQIYQKLITVSRISEVRDTPGERTQPQNIGPYNVFFHMKTDSGKESENGYYRIATDPTSDKTFWIKSDQVQVWATRFAVRPNQVDTDTTFTVVLDESVGGTAPYIAESVPGDATAYAFILEGAEDEDDEGPYDVAFCVARPEDGGLLDSLNDISKMSLDICFVVEDGQYLNAEYAGSDGTERPYRDYLLELGNSWKDTVNRLLAENKELNIPVRMGLISYTDSTDGAPLKEPKVVCQMTDDLENWIQSFERSSIGSSYDGDAPSDGLSAIDVATSNSVGWADMSAKHIVFLANSYPNPHRKGEGGAPPSNETLNWLFDRRDPTSLWKDDWSTMFSVNTSGKSVRELQSNLYPVGGKQADEMKRWRHLHCIHVGLTSEQMFGKELLNSVAEFNNTVKDVLGSESPTNQVDILYKVDALPLAITACAVANHGVWQMEAQKSLKQLAEGSSLYQGFYAHMEPTSEAVNEINKQLGSRIEQAIKVIADIKVGGDRQKNALADRSKTESEFTKPIFKIVGSTLSQEDLIEKPVQTGTAVLRDKNTGRQVGEKVVMVSETELERLGSSLNALYSQFESKRKAADRQNTSKVLEDLQASLATAASGQTIEADTQLQSVITDLPLRTEALQLSAGDIAVMSSGAFDTWLDDVQLAEKQITKLKTGDPKRWINISGLAGTSTKYSFVRMSELP